MDIIGESVTGDKTKSSVRKEEKMRRNKNSSGNIRGGFAAAIVIGGLVLSSICHGYSGGTGEPNNPYQIADVNDLLALAGTTADYNKCFIVTEDINMGGQVFTTAIIAADTNSNSSFQGTAFSGIFDGNGHLILNMTIDANGTGNDFLGLFGWIEPSGVVKNLGIEEVSIIDIVGDSYPYLSDFVGGLCGYNNRGSIINCYTTGSLAGDFFESGGLCGVNNRSTITDCISSVAITGRVHIGGLCGTNNYGNINKCYSAGNVSGDYCIGGLCGESYTSNISDCFSTGKVTGNHTTGGLVGTGEFGSISNCYATGSVTGSGDDTGGLCGENFDSISNCYATGLVTGSDYTGGLCGYNQGDVINCYSTGSITGNMFTGGLCGVNYSTTTSCYFLDTAGPNNGAGVPLTEEQMKQQGSFVSWDFVGEVINGPNDIWKICEGESYPQLWYEKYGGGSGDANNPYLIYTSCQMQDIGANPPDWDKHFKLMADIDMGGYNGTEFNIIGKYVGYLDPCNQPFVGVFDGNGHTISNFTYSTDENDVGIFAYITGGAVIKNVGLINPNIEGGDYVGSLVAKHYNGIITNCYVKGGIVRGGLAVGGLTGYSRNDVFRCYSTAAVIGEDCVGGLAGATGGYASAGNPPGPDPAKITDCYSLGEVSGDMGVGGLVGYNFVWGGGWGDSFPATITNCYSAGAVSGNSHVGGLIGYNNGEINDCFWDVNSSGQASSSGGTDKTTTEMQTESTFTDAGWDFVGEAVNGTNDIWAICEGTNYPKLSWQVPIAGDFVCPDGVEMNDLAVLCEEWLLEEIPADSWPDDGDGIVNFFDWAIFANEWQTTVDFEELADFAKQWLKTGARYCFADIAPDGGDRTVNILDFAVLANNWLEGG
jgi:hypothetical protein